MLVVADSSALLALATCSALETLALIYEDVRVPRAVFDEIAAPDRPHGAVLSAFLVERVVDVDLSHWVLAAGGLGQGELEAMALYKQLSADALLIDDRRARTIAEHRAHIQRVAPYVAALRTSPLHYSEALLAKVMALANEAGTA